MDFFDYWNACLPGHGKHRANLGFHGVNRARVNLIRAAGANLTLGELRFLQQIIC